MKSETYKLFTALNLRLFDLNVQTTELNATGNDLSPEMKTFYHDRLIDLAEPVLIHDQLCEKYPIPKNGGKIIEFRKYSPLRKALNKLTEGVTPDGNKLNVTTLTAEVDQYGDYITISDVLHFTAIDPNLVQATKLLGNQSGRTLDTIDREVMCGGTNKMFAPSVTNGVETEVLVRADVTTKCEFTPNVVKKAAALLKRMNAMPRDGAEFVAVIHTDISCDLQKNPDWIDMHKYTNPEAMFKGEVGKIGNVRFLETTEAKIIGPAWIFGNMYEGGVCRMHVYETEAIGSTQIKIKEAVSAAQAAEFNARIAGGETIQLYFDGTAMAVSACTAGAAGAGYFTVSAIATALAADDLICGYGAGSDGSAIYCTVIVGANAVGTTSIEGMGLEHIVKQLGSAGTADALNQRATTGWKATKVTERLVEEYMIRVEHSSPTFGATATSN